MAIGLERMAAVFSQDFGGVVCVHFWEGKVNRLHRSVGGRRRFLELWQVAFLWNRRARGRGKGEERLVGVGSFSTETTGNELSCLLPTYLSLYLAAQSGGYEKVNLPRGLLGLLACVWLGSGS